MAHSPEKWDRLLITGGGLLADEPEAPERWLGQRLGAFELIEPIGSGGMASVFLGRRADRQFEQQVAVKILSERLHATSHRDRFLRERQILADLEHPGIARIIDGGMTEDDRPYLVMEYVAGTSIDSYCDASEPAPERRVELVLKVCAAVGYAHGRGMVHLDLKPGNILINESGEPKLLDFGIAAAAGGDDRDALAAFTPLYAAPEQVLGGTTSTATDVYQLGLLLYRLLTGRTAFAGSPDDLDALKRRILDDPPPRVADDAPVPSRWRRDLDAILARCLHKDPDQRYRSVAHLVDDLRALIADRPVAAVAATPGYRLAKWYPRRRRAVLAGGALVLLAAAGGGLYWQQLSAQRERADLSADRAAAASALLADILESVDPLAGGGALADVISTSGFELSAARRYRPEVQREIVLMTSRTLLDLGRYRDVVKMVEPLVADPPAADGSSALHAEYLSLLGYAHYRDGDLKQGLALLEAALAAQLADPGVDPEVLATTLQRTALAERRAARPERARGHLERALELLAGALPDNDIRLAQAHNHFGLVLTDLGQYRAAIASFERADAIYQSAPGEQELRRAMTLGNLADAQRLAGGLDAAERNARAAVALAERAPDNPQLLATANVALGNVLTTARRYADAAEHYRQAHGIYARALGPDHPRLALVAHNLGVVLRLDGRCVEALASFDEAIRIAAAAYPEDHPELLESRRQRALCAR